MTENENPNYYAIIPATVRYDVELTANAKLMYGEITCLSNQKGFCYASNGYFAKLYGVTTQAISKWINQLADKGYVRLENIYNGKEIKERHIFIVDVSTNVDRYQQTIDRGINKCLIGYQQKVKDNNININNTSINIIKHQNGTYKNILLTDKEKEKLITDYGEDTVNRAIEFLSSYKIEKGYVTKSDYLTIRRWVIKAVTEKKNYKSGLQDCDRFKDGELNNFDGFENFKGFEK